MIIKVPSADVVSASQPPPILTPAQFMWLLAYSGLDDVWEALEKHLKGTDRAAYADLKSNTVKASYHLDVVLAAIENLQPFVAAVAPGVDLSEKTVRTMWQTASTYGVDPVE